MYHAFFKNSTRYFKNILYLSEMLLAFIVCLKRNKYLSIKGFPDSGWRDKNKFFCVVPT